MIMGVLANPAAFNDPVAEETRMTSDVLPSGVNPVRFDPYALPPAVPGRNARGGINYIDQEAGAGTTGPRSDATVRALNGIIGIRQRRQPMNGDYIARSVPVTTRTTGNVGFRQSQAGQRGTAADTTNVPSQGSITAAFTSPALASLVAKIRGKHV